MSKQNFAALPHIRRNSKLLEFAKVGARLARLAAVCALFLAPVSALAPVRGDRWLADVKYLASDELKGRGDGSPELDQAADYIAHEFRELKLEPFSGGYFQPFDATVGADLGPNNSLVSLETPPHAFQMRKDYIPLSFSGSGELTGNVAFVGYGITAPEYRYDDYAGIDAKGKIVVLLRHEPQEDDEKSVFLGKRMTRHAALYSKAMNARNHGAAAMLLVNDPVHHNEDKLIRFGDGGTDSVGMLSFQVERSAAERWMKPSGHSLEELQKEIDKDLSNHSFLLPSTVQLKIEGDVKVKHATLKNVAGLLRGSDPKLRDEVIVIGAHYDHLGLGDYDSLAPDKIGQIHHGADDNASGTAGMMELARSFTADGARPRRSILFLAFAGEELGLFGSADYVKEPLLPLDRTVAMLNLDMIGRVKGNKLYVGGVGTSPGFRSLVTEENKSENGDPAFQIDFSDTGYDASDHMSFARKDVPVMFFFSGLHADYHKPTDTWDKMEPEAVARVLALVARVAKRIDAADERPVYVQARADRRNHGNGEGERPTAESGSQGEGQSGYGPYFGSIPDFGEQTNGVKFADVREGSPAGKAGLKAGDILTEFDGKPVQNLYDFTYALQAKNVDDVVPVVVLRGGEKVRVMVKLGRRE